MVRQPASQRAVAQNEINKDNMKIIRNIARRPWPRIGGWLPVMMLICGGLASCSSEMQDYLQKLVLKRFPKGFSDS